MHKLDKHIEEVSKRVESCHTVQTMLMSAYRELENSKGLDEDLRDLLKDMRAYLHRGIEWVDTEGTHLDLDLNVLKMDRHAAINRALDRLDWDEIEMVKYDKVYE